ncbi:hypothetical protein [Streptomyces sp. NRRL S-455]|uniref:hypothetical protein n=1 Tax=Streptomyces sp. NRRL S-455 TaxID=1463908 RepID=UPI0004C08AD0|nr:hypothetical protein [Streptomyces sp. NRRL S-455]
MSSALPEWLVDYVLKRDQQRADEVNAVLAAMSERERRLVREAAVMAYVHGRQHPNGADHPKDSTVLANVIGACLANADLYPVTNYVAKVGPPVALTPCTHVKALHDTEHDGLIVEGCSWCAGREQLGTPGHTKPLMRVTSTGLRPGLTDAERAMLRYALELAENAMASEGDEFSDDDHEAVASLKLLAGEE